MTPQPPAVSPITRRIGLLGGTFDPPHIGHLIAAELVRDRLVLDEVWFVVAGDPWQKSDHRPITEAERRLAMVEAAIDGVPQLIASDIELDRDGPSYTIDTLETLTQHHRSDEFFVLIGADAAAGLPSWHRAEELRRRARFVVVNRPGAAPHGPPGWDCQGVEIPPIGISSTDIRQRVTQGRTIRFLVPDAVARLIAAWGLYQTS